MLQPLLQPRVEDQVPKHQDTASRLSSPDPGPLQAPRMVKNRIPRFPLGSVENVPGRQKGNVLEPQKAPELLKHKGREMRYLKAMCLIIKQLARLVLVLRLMFCSKTTPTKTHKNCKTLKWSSSVPWKTSHSSTFQEACYGPYRNSR